MHQLAEHAYLATEPDPAARWATIVTATPAGLQFFADSCAMKEEIESTFTTPVGEEQLATLMATLEKLASAFSAYSKAGSPHPLSDDGDNRYPTP